MLKPIFLVSFNVWKFQIEGQFHLSINLVIIKQWTRETFLGECSKMNKKKKFTQVFDRALVIWVHLFWASEYITALHQLIFSKINCLSFSFFIPQWACLFKIALFLFVCEGLHFMFKGHFSFLFSRSATRSNLFSYNWNLTMAIINAFRNFRSFFALKPWIYFRSEKNEA